MIEYEDQLLYDTRIYKTRKRLGRQNSFRVLTSEFVTYKKSEVSRRTLQTYRSKLRCFDAFLGKASLNDKPITVADNEVIIRFLKKLADAEDLSRLSIEKYHQILFSFFKWVSDIKNHWCPVKKNTLK